MNALIIGTTGVTLHGDIRVQSPDVRSRMSHMSNIAILLLLYTCRVLRQYCAHPRLRQFETEELSV